MECLSTHRHIRALLQAHDTRVRLTDDKLLPPNSLSMIPLDGTVGAYLLRPAEQVCLVAGNRVP
jgi:hypothetical protein